jgi:hypothetical protein
MLSVNDTVIKIITAIAFLLFLIPPPQAECQQGILDSAFTFRAGTIKTGNALQLITRQTGYHFTYDSRLIDAERKTEMNFRKTKLEIILDSILKNNSLEYSVIDKYIIISREIPPAPSGWGRFNNNSRTGGGYGYYT